MADTVLINTEGHILTITLNRPEKKNALTSQMYQAMSAGLNQASASDQIRVVLFRANGDSFTAGNDLKDFSTWTSSGSKLEDLPVAEFIHRVATFEKPLVAEVKGAAVGLGTTLLLHCDVVVAGKSTRFSLPFVRLGLVPEFGSTYLLPAIAGRVLASHYLLLAEPFGAQQAKEMGIVSLICEDEQVEEIAHQKAKALCELPPRALFATRKLLHPQQNREQLLKVIAEEMRFFKKGLASEEHHQAIAAFFSKK